MMKKKNMRFIILIAIIISQVVFTSDKMVRANSNANLSYENAMPYNLVITELYASCMHNWVKSPTTQTYQKYENDDWVTYQTFVFRCKLCGSYFYRDLKIN